MFTSLTLSSALLFGALISATDPVAVIALFNEIKAPKRLLTLIDGESIFNDATAIVLFTILMAVPISSVQDVSQQALPGFISFILVLCGGVIIGIIVGLLGSLMLHIKKGDMILQFTVTLITAYVSFILADKLKASGVISTLCAGLVFSATSDFTIRRRHRESLHHFWEYFAFTANSFVFLLLGFTELSIFHTQKSIQHSIWIILLSIPIIVIARACVIYILVPLYNKFTSEENKISAAYQAILLWGGLRGAVPVALVFSITEDYPHRIIN
jgi:CPA1 family monovalent cation:H+ antiporter